MGIGQRFPHRRVSLKLLGRLPNAVTLIRLGCAPAVIALIAAGNLVAAFWVFVAAGLSDALDGLLARLLHAQTVLGSYLDALADKVLLVGMYISLTAIGLVDVRLTVLVVGRDSLLLGWTAFDWLNGVKTSVHPLLISKINTAAQMALAAEVVAHEGLGVFSAALMPPLVAVVVATTLLSGIAYGAVRWKIGIGRHGR